MNVKGSLTQEEIKNIQMSIDIYDAWFDVRGQMINHWVDTTINAKVSISELRHLIKVVSIFNFLI